MKADESYDALLERAAKEVDHSLLEWFLGLSVADRLRTASRNAAALDRMTRAATTDR